MAPSQHWREARLAVAFLTRLPVAAAGHDGATIAGSAWAWPAVGAILGLAAAAVLALCRAAGLPEPAASLAAVLAVIAVTGALHEDGLADTADGMATPGTPDRVRAAMRDSRLGTAGVVALVGGIGLRVAALAGLAGPAEATAALVAALAGGRALMAGAMRWAGPLPGGPSAQGLAGAAGAPSAAATGVALGSGALALLALGPLSALLAALAAIGTALVVAGWARRRLGGASGDCLGAIEQGGETMILLIAAAAA